jgi:acyl carrier protein
MESILDQIRQIAANVFDVPVEQVTAQSSPDTIENWDSLGQLNIVLALEENFGRDFTPEEIEQMLSIELIAMLVQEKVSQAN